MRAVSNQTLQLRDVMRGVQLSVSLPNPATYSPAGFVNIDESGAIKTGQEAGFMVEILDEVAARAGFTWRQSFAFFQDPDDFGKSWTDLVTWQISTYDMSGIEKSEQQINFARHVYNTHTQMQTAKAQQGGARGCCDCSNSACRRHMIANAPGEWWVPTVGRRALGVSFLEGFFDSSMILLSQAQGKKEPTFGELFVSWAGPLDFGVWMMILAFAVCVGLAYSFIEEGTEGSDVDRDDPHHNRAASIFSALLLFTGGGGPAPRTFPGLFLLFGWSLFVLVLVNSYAANLGLGFRV